MPKPLRDWHGKDPASAAHWQEAVSALRELQGVDIPGNGGEGRIDLRLGVIVAAPTGQSEYTDSRYWVKFLAWQNTNAAVLDAEDEYDFELPDESTVRQGEAFTATNLSESYLTVQQHWLSAGQGVQLVGIWDAGPTGGEPSKHWYMNEGPWAKFVTFPVTVTVDGGIAGTFGGSCTLTYTVKSLTGKTLSMAESPQKSRIPNIEYNSPAADSPGLAYYSAITDALVLYDVAQEYPVLTAVSPLTAWRFNTSTGLFQYKLTPTRVPAGSEGDWINAYEPADCT